MNNYLNEKKVSDLTKNPKLWRCYWGNFKAEENKDSINAEIIENRNSFEKEFGLKKLIDFPRGGGFVNSTHDHSEIYSCEDGKIIFVCSNYGDKKPDKAEELGMKLYSKIYSKEATTWISIFPDKKEFVSKCRKVLNVNRYND
jgi:hypothetical protein